MVNTMYENARYYKSQSGVIYRTMGVGYHINTGEHIIVMREVSSGNVWCIPATDVNDRRMVNGSIVYNYQRCDEEGNVLENDNSKYDADDTRRDARCKSPYPGSSDSAGLVRGQTASTRNNRCGFERYDDYYRTNKRVQR